MSSQTQFTIESKETFFDLYTEKTFDKKHKLNTSKKVINSNDLDIIDEGVTIEYLDTHFKNIDIFKYRTQITMHGIFKDFNESYYIGNYKHIFKNKNESLGVKYNAIDFDKKKRIYLELRNYLDFYVIQNSTDFYAYKLKNCTDKETYLKTANEFKDFANSINKNLFCGVLSVYAMPNLRGGVDVCLMFDIKFIYEINIGALLFNFGITNELKETINKQKELEALERKKRYEAKEAKETEQKNAILERYKSDFELLDSKYKKDRFRGVLGTFIEYDFECKVINNEIVNTGLEYKVYHVYMPKGKKIARYNYNFFKTLNEALEYAPKENSYDSKFQGSINGWQIK